MSPKDLKPRSPVRRLLLALALIAITAAGAAFFIPHCVSPSDLAAIHSGMTKQEVVALLGPPQSVKSDAPNHARLLYGVGRWCDVTVHLDGESRVQSVFHDH
jgi:hypothetical protein